MSVLILAEYEGEQLNPAVYQTITAAKTWATSIDVLVVGNAVTGLAAIAATIIGVDRVLLVQAEHLTKPLAEDVANIIAGIGGDYQVILGAHSSFSRNILPRAAAQLDVAMISDVLKIKPANTYIRSIYAGSVYSTVQSQDAIQVLTVHNSNFARAELLAAGQASAEIIAIEAPAAFEKTRWISETRMQSDMPALGSAKIVVSGGRSLGSAEKFNAVLTPLAQKLGAALGATRAAVDAGFAPNEIQVGQSGVVVAPELYIAVGVSGAVQHTYGMKDSKVIVAINQDPDAAIFQVADYGLVADLFEAVPALTAAID